MSVELEVIRRIERLHELRSEWSRRMLAVENTPFQSPEWLLTWWKYFCSGELHTLAAWDGSTLVGLLPCFRHLWQDAQQLTIIGSGITDYLEPYIVDEHAGLVVEAIGDHLCRDTSYDLCDWQDLPAQNPLLELEKFPGLCVSIAPDTVCSEVNLIKGFDDYWQNRSPEMRRNVRRYSEKAEQRGPLKFACDNFLHGQVLDSLLDLHTARWHKRGESGMIEANRSGAFLREVSDNFARLGLLRLFSLRWNERIVAAILAFSWKRKIYAYLSAFEPEFEQFGFGRILLSKSIQHSCATDHIAWNFLRGAETYKTSWGARSIPKCRIVIRRDLSA